MTDATSAAELALSPEGQLTIVDEDGDRRLLRSGPSATAPQTDERPTYRMSVEGAESLAPSDQVLAGALVEHGVVWVTPVFELVDGQGAILDRDVVPELAVSADGRTVAYPHRAGEGAGVYVVSQDDSGWSAPRLVTETLASADRPLFLDDGRLLVVGSVSSGIAGIWIVDAGQLVPVTNATLRTGRPLGPSFVPPPAHHSSMRVESGALVYDDGYGERRVALPVAR